LIFAGIGLTFIGVLVIFLALLAGGEGVSGGIVIFIGPFPVALGYGPEALPLLAVAFLIAVVVIVASLVWFRSSRPHGAPAQPQP